MGQTSLPLALPDGLNWSALSSPQRLLLFLETHRPRTRGAPKLALVIAYRLNGPLDLSALRDALHGLWLSHGVLRSGSHAERIGSLGMVDPPLLLERKQVQFQAGQTHVEAIAGFLAAEHMRPFEIGGNTYIRATVGEITRRDHILFLSVHCIAADARALELVMEELASRYASAKGLPNDRRDVPEQPAAPVPTNEAECQDSADGIQFWQRRLQGASSLPRKAFSIGLADEDSEATNTVTAELERDSALAAKELCLAMNVTPFVLGLSAWAGWTRKRTSSDDLLLSTLTLARHTPEEEVAIGTFLQLLLMPMHVPRASSFIMLVDQVREVVLEALDRYVPLWDLLKGIPGLPAVLSDRNALLLPFQALPENSLPGLSSFGNCHATLLGRFVSRNAGFSLPLDGLLTMKWGDGRCGFELEYRAQIMTPAEAYQLLAEFRDYFGAAVKAPYGSLSAIVTAAV